MARRKSLIDDLFFKRDSRKYPKLVPSVRIRTSRRRRSSSSYSYRPTYSYESYVSYDRLKPAEEPKKTTSLPSWKEAVKHADEATNTNLLAPLSLAILAAFCTYLLVIAFNSNFDGMKILAPFVLMATLLFAGGSWVIFVISLVTIFTGKSTKKDVIETYLTEYHNYKKHINQEYENLLCRVNEDSKPLERTLQSLIPERYILKKNIEELKDRLSWFEFKKKQTQNELYDKLIEEVNDELNLIEQKKKEVYYDLDSSPEYDELDEFEELVRTFMDLNKSQRLWQVTNIQCSQETKTSYSASISSKDVKLMSEGCELIKFSLPVPSFKSSSTGNTYYLYPGFVLETTSKSIYHVMNYSDLNITIMDTKYFDEDSPPSDSEHLFDTYKHVNKNGSPDRRFNYNPIMHVNRYGCIMSNNDLGIYYQISNYNLVQAFATAYNNCAELYDFKLEF